MRRISLYGDALRHAFAERPAPMPPLDLDAALRRGYDLRGADSWDRAAAHASDLSSLCDRETWARRTNVLSGESNYPPMERPDADAQIGFDLGHIAEEVLLDRIEAGLSEGWTVDRQATVYLGLDENVRIISQSGGSPPPWPHVVGHVDAVLRPRVGPAIPIDTKTTVWWNRNERGRQVWYPKDPEGKQGHRLQIATYALALDAEVCGLFELDLGGKGRRAIWLDPEPYRPLVEHRLAEVLRRTDPALPEPQVLPNPWTFVAAQRDGEGRIVGGDSWACGYVNGNGDVKRGYCSHTTCPRHVANMKASF